MRRDPKPIKGAIVKHHSKEDPPYEVDEKRYKRFNQKYDMYARPSWDHSLKETLFDPGRANALKVLKKNETGLTRLEFALYTASWTVGTTLGNMNGTVGSGHYSLYSLDSIPGSFQSYNDLFDDLEKWNPDYLSPEDLATLLKFSCIFIEKPKKKRLLPPLFQSSLFN